MSQEAKKQLDLIKSMLAKGHGFTLSPHSLTLWGVVAGMQPLFNTIAPFFINDHKLLNYLTTAVTIVVLVVAYFFDRYLTNRYKATQQATMPLVQKQIMRFVFWVLIIIVSLHFLLVYKMADALAESSFIFLVAVLLFNIGLFSNKLFCWIAVVIAVVNWLAVFYWGTFIVNRWLFISILIIGFPLLQWLITGALKQIPNWVKSAIFGAVIIGVTTLGVTAERTIKLFPGELPVKGIEDQIGKERFILDLPVGTQLTGDLSVDRFKKRPLVMPEIQLRVTKPLQIIIENKQFAHRFKVQGGVWQDREPFQGAKQWYYALISTPNGANFDLFLPYFTGDLCDCISIVNHKQLSDVNKQNLVASNKNSNKQEEAMPEKSNPFPNSDFKAFEFSKADMTASKFNGVNLSRAEFWAVLENAKFIDSNMAATQFNNVNLANSHYENINLSNSVFNDINLSNVSFSNINMSSVEVNDANLEGMRINGVLVTDLFQAYEKNN